MPDIIIIISYNQKIQLGHIVKKIPYMPLESKLMYSVLKYSSQNINKLKIIIFFSF